MEQTSIAKKLYLALGCALLGAALALAFPGELSYEAIAAPVNALGQALRGLSLSGTGGNAAAWAITLVVSLLPLIPFLLLRRRRRAAADGVLLLLIPQVFALLYCAVNPTLVGGMAAPFLPVAQLGVMAATAVTWLVLTFLRALAEAPGERLAAAYEMVGNMQEIIREAHEGGKIHAFLEYNDAGVTIPLGKYDALISYTGASASFFSGPGTKDRSVAGGFIIERSEDEFLICGSGFSVQFLPKPGVQAVAGVLRKEEGRYQGGVWIPGRVLNGDEGYFIRLSDFPQVQRVWMYTYC